MTYETQKYRVEKNAYDSSNDLAKQGFIVEVEHVPTGHKVSFKAFLTSFNDTFQPNWTPEEVYGRADPIYSYKNTKRNITMNWKMVAHGEGEAYQNLLKAQKLAQFTYPNYSVLNNCGDRVSRTVSQGPLLRLKFVNLIRDTKTINVAKGVSEKEIYNSYDNGGNGLLGFFSSVTVNFNLERDEGGAFRLLEEIEDDDGNITYQAKNGVLLPKQIDIQVGGFNPIHEHYLGWDNKGNFSGGISFPYGVQEYIPDPNNTEGEPKEPIEENTSTDLDIQAAELGVLYDTQFA